MVTICVPMGDCSRESLSKPVSAKPFYKYKETFSFPLPSFTPFGGLKLPVCSFLQPWVKTEDVPLLCSLLSHKKSWLLQVQKQNKHHSF